MKAYELIDDESKWCSDAFAKDADGNHVYWRSDEAVQFDLFGAIHRIYHGVDLEAVYANIMSQVECSEGYSLPYYNRVWGWQGCYDFLKKYNL